MMMDKKTIQEMAFWVRVHIPDAEAEEMAKEFSETLNWMGERFKNPELQALKPMVTPFDEPIPLREDVVTDGNKAGEVLSNAPCHTDEFFAVPKMVGGESS